MSKPVNTGKGDTQGGPGSPGFWRAYTIDMIVTMHESDEQDTDDNSKQNGKMVLLG